MCRLVYSQLKAWRAMLACLAQSVGVRLCWILTHLTKKNLFIFETEEVPSLENVFE